MSNLVIVALPTKDDYVNKISSQKVPHMTLLFLGEVAKAKNLAKILDFTGHSSMHLERFGLEVDRRETLGADQADVLSFAKTKWSGFEAINTFRSNLLKHDNIRTTYDSVEQFSEWRPHLTLGYPDAPAKPDNRDYPGITYVTFDRIAVWFSEFEGVEFPLKAYDWDMEVAMSDISVKEAVQNALTHFGKKGMKWGVRNRVFGNTTLGKPPANLSRNTYRRKLKLAKTVDKIMKKEYPRINSKPEYVKAHAAGNLTASSSVGRKYTKEVADTYFKEYQKAFGTPVSRDGKQKFILKQDKLDYLGFTITTVNMKHDDSAPVRITFIRDENGFIVGADVSDGSIEQGAMVVDDILIHFGKKGMRWGVRNTQRPSGPQGVVITDKKKKIKTSGGQGHPAHSDAIRARTLGQRGKKSGVKSLSDKELQAYAKRLNLEGSVKRLDYAEKNAAKKFVATILGQTGKNQASEVASNVASTQVKKHLTRRLVKIGAATAI